MVKGIVKCSSNCSNPELSGTAVKDIFELDPGTAVKDIFELDPGTWNISAQSRVDPSKLIKNDYYIISPLDHGIVAGLNYIKVHDEAIYADTVIYDVTMDVTALNTPEPTIYRFDLFGDDGYDLGEDSKMYEFKDSKDNSVSFYAGEGEKDGDDGGNYFVRISTNGQRITLPAL